MSISASFEGVGSAVPGSGTETVPYRLSVFPFPPGHFRVHSFRAREALSKPYAFDVTVTTTELVGEDLERLALGQRAAFVMTLDGVTRVVCGIIAAVRSEGVRALGPADTAAQYRMRLVPRLWRLGRRKGSRIFQTLRVDEVVSTVLAEAGIRAEWHLSRKYAVRAYATQYEETDLAFVERLLAEAGIFFYFAPPTTGLEGLLEAVLGAASGTTNGPLGDALALAAATGALVYPEETLVLTDDPACYPPLPSGGVLGTVEAIAAAAGAPAGVSVGAVSVSMPSPALHFLSEHGFAVGRSDKVTALAAQRRVRSNVAEYRDFDPERPTAPLVFRDGDRRPGAAGAAMAAAEGALAQGSVSVDLDLEAGPSLSAAVGAAAMGALTGLLERRDLETYEHHGRFLFPDWADAADEPGRMRRERGRRAVTAAGASLCPAFAPGCRFHLEGHPVGPFNREWTLIAVRHAGDVAQPSELYQNSFECVPATVAYPPKRQARRTVQSTLTATVVGPAGEEIWVDAAGRIKVRFHWDRRGSAADTASCWIRAMQPWAGAGWGHQFIPRVGMEVVVVFEGGDPDKPLVIGSVYNGTHPPAFPLPEDKTRSGVRTQSTPHARGYNELSFQDLAGREQILVHAQRDLDEVVERTHTLAVGRDELIHVKGLRRDEVVEGATEIVGGDKDVTVHGDRTTAVDGTLLGTVGRNADLWVHGGAQLRVDDRYRLAVAGPAEERFAQDLLTRVDGNHVVVVGRNESKRSFTLRVEGTTTLSAEDGLVFQCPAGISFACGSTTVRIGPDGIELVGDLVRLTGKNGGLEVSDAGLKLKSAGARVELAKGLVAQTAEASLSLDKEFKADGKKILLNSPDQATDEPPPPPAEPTIIELTDGRSRPLPGRSFTIALEDGTERVGVTDKDGKATLELEDDGTIRFPGLTLADQAPPTATTDADYAPYVVGQGDHLRKVAFHFGIDPKVLWDDPKNAKLKEQRGDGRILAAGDVLFIPKDAAPGPPVRATATNRYHAEIPSMPVNVTVSGPDGPLANQPYEVRGLRLRAGEAAPTGTTDDAGRAELRVPVDLRVVEIYLPRLHRVIRLRVGDMDPMTEESGIVKRLINAGIFDHATDPGRADVAEGLRAYQLLRGLPITGRLDQATERCLDEDG